jgi:hypothetical protein
VTALLILFGAVVKMFPFFGITVLLKEEKNRFLRILALCSVIFGLYMAATWESVQAAWNLTMRGDGLSYGTNVFVTRYEAALTGFLSRWLTPHRIELLLEYGPLIGGFFLILLVFLLARGSAQAAPATADRNLDAFRMGASIFAGTFLLGNNFDYRLAFLVLVVPQLMKWVYGGNRSYRLAAGLALFLTFVSCWHLWIIEIPLGAMFRSVEDAKKFWIILDEIFNWTLFASLAYLLFASAPGWVKEMPGSLFLKKEFSSHHEQSRLPLP